MSVRLFANVAIATVLLSGCNAIPAGPSESRIIRVSLPADVFTLQDEVFAVKAAARRGDAVKNARIPLDSLDKFGEYRDLYLLEYNDGKVEILSYRREGNAVVADLVGGTTYLVVPELLQFISTYKVFCVLDRFVARNEPGIIDPICLRILCSADAFAATKLYEEFEELGKYKKDLGFGDMTGTIGGWGDPPPEHICERCTRYNPPDMIYPVFECFGDPATTGGGGGSTPTPQWEADVINMIPLTASNEVNQDSEPSIAVDRIDTNCMAGTAFTPAPNPNGNAPIYVTADGGDTWTLNQIVNSQGQAGTGDITVAPGNESLELYAGILRQPSMVTTNFDMRELQTDDYTVPGTMTQLAQKDGPDQPWVQTHAVPGNDRIYVGNNDLALITGSGGNGRTATVDVSLDSGTTVNSFVIETRGTGTAGQDAPAVRVTIANDGTVYAAYFGWRSLSANADGTLDITTDVVVVRDDDGDPTTNPFGDLVDPGDNLAGIRVVENRAQLFSGTIGQNRLVSSNLSIAVDPNNSDVVYLAWTNQTGASVSTMFVRRSLDRGQTWSSDLRTLVHALNPALAVLDDGTVGLLYQAITGSGSGPSVRWRTSLKSWRAATKPTSGSNDPKMSSPKSRPAKSVVKFASALANPSLISAPKRSPARTHISQKFR